MVVQTILEIQTITACLSLIFVLILAFEHEANYVLSLSFFVQSIFCSRCEFSSFGRFQIDEDRDSKHSKITNFTGTAHRES